MNLKLKRVGPLQAGKMLAALYGLLSLVIVPFMFVGMALASFGARHGATPPFPLLFGLGFGFVFVVPVIYATIGFVFGVLTAWVYNQLSKWLGGFEMEFEPSVPPAVPAGPP